MHEYAFDVKLFATIRIAADSPETARAILRDSGQCMTITIQEHAFGYQNTEASVDEAENDELIEIDGVSL